jgi:hypothetical protein
VTPRPCIGCGHIIDHGSRCHACTPRRTCTRGTKGRTQTDWQWRKLSQRLRKTSPFCEIPGCTSSDLTVDHIIPPTERPDLAHEELNCRVYCRSHNAARSNRCTDEERQQVLDAIARRK